ncbi:MAG: cyclic nucleotide-binding domain-containing protein [Lentisphaerae bacterium]|nr:cyclic nucleotide-binding domain-containing protein [Lentisphaerota bacterium]
MFLDGIDTDELAKLEALGTFRSYLKGSFIVEDGATGTSFNLVLSGRAEVRKDLNDNQSTAVAELKAFDLIGELGFFGVERRSASVIATENCDVLEFGRDAFTEFSATNPKIGMKIYRNMARILANRLADTDTKLRDAVIWALSCTTVEQRKQLRDIRQNHRLRIRED